MSERESARGLLNVFALSTEIGFECDRLVTTFDS